MKKHPISLSILEEHYMILKEYGKEQELSVTYLIKKSIRDFIAANNLLAGEPEERGKSQHEIDLEYAAKRGRTGFSS